MNRFIQPAAIVACIAGANVSIPAYAQQWQGAWTTTFGEVRLVEDGDHVYGDFRGGTIEGILDRTTGRLRAIFRNPDGTSGYAELLMLPGNRGFAGSWDWENQTLPRHDAGAADRKWSGTRTAATMPPIISFKLPASRSRFISTAPAKYRGWITGFSGSATASTTTASSGTPPPPPPPPAPAPTQPAAAPVAHGLEHRRDLTPAKIATAFEMQRHVRAVSQQGDRQQSGEQAGAAYYRTMGWQLLGQGIITDGGLRDSLLRAGIAKKGNAVVVAFRGTKGDAVNDTITSAVMLDGNIRQVQPSFIPASQRGNVLVHAGFLNSYLTLRSKVLDALEGQQGVHLFITGHSLGGAIASLMAYDMGVNRPGTFASITLITSGAPRVGNPAFVADMNRFVPDNLRIVVNHDPVPAVPYLGGKYQHAGRLLVIGRDDGVLVQHDDIDVHANAVQFRFHKNEDYYDAVRMVRDRAPRTNALNPNGNAWATAAAAREVVLASQPRPGGLRDRLTR
ncbi:MAG: lipase family protein [Sphingomonadaceae bacterium]